MIGLLKIILYVVVLVKFLMSEQNLIDLAAFMYLLKFICDNFLLESEASNG